MSALKYLEKYGFVPNDATDMYSSNTKSYHCIEEIMENYVKELIDSVTDEAVENEAEERNPTVKHMVNYNSGMNEGFIDGFEWLKSELLKKIG